MKGLIIKHLGREYRVQGSVVSSLVLHRDEFILEGGGYIASFQKIRDDIEFDVGIGEFEHATELISENNDFSEIDPEYTKMLEERDSEWEWSQKLRMFREIESVLQEEGLL